MLSSILDFLFKPFTDVLIRPYLTAKLRSAAYQIQIAYSGKLLESGEPDQSERAIAILVELGMDYSYRRQEVVDRICSFLRTSFPQNRDVMPEWLPVLNLGIRSLTSLPRYDVNGNALNIDLRQMRIESPDPSGESPGGKLDLTRTNFKDLTMWGCIFKGVELARSNFENCDIGGSVFEECSLEWCNFKNAKLNASFMDQGRPTTFRRTRLWGTNLNEAVIDLCHLHNSDGFDLRPLQPLIDCRKIHLIG
jgi:uncharacterized protein YjbI with pentapeptide repeats